MGGGTEIPFSSPSLHFRCNLSQCQMSGSDLRPKEQSVREARLGTAAILGFPLNHRGNTAPRHAHSKNPKVKDIPAPSPISPPQWEEEGGSGDREDSKPSLQILLLNERTPRQWVFPFMVQILSPGHNPKSKPMLGILSGSFSPKPRLSFSSVQWILQCLSVGCVEGVIQFSL